MENAQKLGIPDLGIRKYVAELAIIFFLSILVYLISARYDIIDQIYEFSRAHEDYELDEVLSIFIFLVFSLSLFAVRRWIEVHRILGELVVKNEKFEKSIC